MPLFRDKFADRLYAHLLNLGVRVELLNEHPLRQVATKKRTFGKIAGHVANGILEGVLTGGLSAGGDLERKSLGLIQVSGKSIDYINVISTSSESGKLMSRDYFLEYLVLLEDIPPNSCWAVLEIKKRGLFRRKVADIEWTGGILADKLNGDLTLKDNLLKEFQLNRPLAIIVVDEPAYQCARIETGERRLDSESLRNVLDGIDRIRESGDRRPIPLPSGNLFDCIDRIAGLTVEHVTEVNS